MTFLGIVLLVYFVTRVVLYLRTRIPGSPFAAWVMLTIVADLVFLSHWVRARFHRAKPHDWDEELRNL